MALLRRRRHGIKGDLATIPIIQNMAGDLSDIGDTAAQELATLVSQEHQEFVGVVEKANVVQGHEARGGTAGDDDLHGGDRVLEQLDLDTIAQGDFSIRLSVVALLGKHDPRAVQELDVLIEGDLLSHFGEARGGAYAAYFGPFERVDDGRLAHVGVANDAHGDRGFEVEVAGVVFEETHQCVGTQAFRRVEEVFRGEPRLHRRLTQVAALALC